MNLFSPSDPDGGYSVADVLGVEIREEYGDGEDGSVFLLDDGRVMKVTWSATEAAICLGLMEAQETHGCHPAVPWVSLVAMHETEECVPLPDGTTRRHAIRRYVVIRDDMPDPRMPYDRQGGWRLDLDSIALWASEGWLGDPPELVSPPRLREDALSVAASLQWIEAVTGALVTDLHDGNVGRTPAGGVGMRDLGRADGVRQDLMDRVRAGDLPTTHEIGMEASPRP